MKHLESCVRRAVKTRKVREKYNEENPMHCEFCEGWGGTITATDPYLRKVAEIGNRFASVNDCESCVQEGRCPRCSSDFEVIEDDTSLCDFCGFELGVTEGKPYPHICVCYELDNFDDMDEDDDD